MSCANFSPFQNLSTPTFKYQIKYQSSGQRLYLRYHQDQKLLWVCFRSKRAVTATLKDLFRFCGEK